MLLGLLLYAVALAAAPRNILVLGDSLSAAYGMESREGWVALLERRLAEGSAPYRVVNASVSGETTSGALSRLPRLLEIHSPAIVVVELGGNDGLRALPLDQIRANLRAIVRASRAGGAKVLLVGMRIPPNYGPAYTRRFEAIYPELAAELKLPLVPFLLNGVAGEETLMQVDAVHASAEAQPRLLENVWPHLRPLLGSP